MSHVCGFARLSTFYFLLSAFPGVWLCAAFYFLRFPPPPLADRRRIPPESPRSTSDRRSEVLRGDSRETTVGLPTYPPDSLVTGGKRRGAKGANGRGKPQRRLRELL